MKTPRTNLPISKRMYTKKIEHKHTLSPGKDLIQMRLAHKTLNATQSAIPEGGKKQEIIVFKHSKKEKLKPLFGEQEDLGTSNFLISIHKAFVGPEEDMCRKEAKNKCSCHLFLSGVSLVLLLLFHIFHILSFFL